MALSRFKASIILIFGELKSAKMNKRLHKIDLY